MENEPHTKIIVLGSDVFVSGGRGDAGNGNAAVTVKLERLTTVNVNVYVPC